MPQALAKELRFFIDAATSEGISGIWQRLVESAVYQITPEEWEALPPDDRTALEAFAAERNPDALGGQTAFCSPTAIRRRRWRKSPPPRRG
ncbi:MAG: hypothetical protein R3F11_24140 [Verrucomicrobiales bacterium]